MKNQDCSNLIDLALMRKTSFSLGVLCPLNLLLLMLFFDFVWKLLLDRHSHLRRKTIKYSAR